MSYAILFVLLIPIGIMLFVFFDLIVRLEYQCHNSEWEKDQQPVGFFWRPEDASVWSGSISRSRLASVWLYRTPAWALLDKKAMRLLFWYRAFWWAAMIGWVTGLIYVVVGPRTN